MLANFLFEGQFYDRVVHSNVKNTLAFSLLELSNFSLCSFLGMIVPLLGLVDDFIRDVLWEESFQELHFFRSINNPYWLKVSLALDLNVLEVVLLMIVIIVDVEPFDIQLSQVLPSTIFNKGLMFEFLFAINLFCNFS